MTAWRVHRWWFLRAAAVLVITCLLDAAVGGFAANPFPWVVLIPATLPLSMTFFVSLPLLRKEQQDGGAGPPARD